MYKRLMHSIWKLWININLLMRIEGYRRAAYIKKHHLFAEIGENCYFHPWKLPGDSKHIHLGNNVKIASEVLFINHDILDALFNTKNNSNLYRYYVGEIVIHDNVMVGSRSVILPDVTIGPNAIVGAGTVCAKDVKEGCIVRGEAAKVCGDFAELEKRRLYEDRK